jgi:protein TonB
MWAVRHHEQGTVDVSLTIGIDGTVKDEKIIRSSGFVDLDSAALTCMEEWSFQPATLNGEPVESVRPYNFTWSLR